MRKLILLLVLTAKSFIATAGLMESPGLLSRKPANIVETGKIKSLSLKDHLIARKEFKKTSRERFIPKFSMDLLDGKGIHLFSTSKVGPVPPMNIGARINAGIKITL